MEAELKLSGDNRLVNWDAKMKMPYQPFMAARPYKAYAQKAVEERRRSIESSLNSTRSESILIFAALCIAFAGGYLAWEKSVLTALIAFFGIWIGVIAIGWPQISHRNVKEEGKWVVTSRVRGGFRRGSTAVFLCERKIRNKVVESCTKE